MEKREKLSFNTNAKLGKLVGRELITNNIIAVFELIKNSYDAFANVVCIEFVNFDTSGADEELRDRNKRDIIVSKPSSKIIISDDGWGMSFFEIKNNWMEIGTTSKEDLTEQRIMHGSRILKRVINGEKGIGRFGCDKLGICGEHGGDPSSVEFCNKIGLDYVSCSPFRVPIARLAAAQAAIAQK